MVAQAETRWGRASCALLAGGATLVIGLASLLAGMAPPGVIGTGQLDPLDWWASALVGFGLVWLALFWMRGRMSATFGALAALAMIVPPVVLCLSGSPGDVARFSIWLTSRPSPPHPHANAPRVAVLSGPRLFAPVAVGMAGFSATPLWRALSLQFVLQPIDALDAGTLRQASALLVIQPRALMPAELVALDGWVRDGGRAVLLADPELRWVDGRAIGHPLRPPPTSLLGPLLAHWGLRLEAATPSGRDPVERRILDDGRLLQLAGASRFSASGHDCTLSSGGLVARCRIGRGVAILVADADFANDSLWTTDPQAPRDPSRWSSDAVPALADWLVDGGGAVAGRRVWLARADGLAEALRPALLVLFALAAAMALTVALLGTKDESKAKTQDT